MFRKKPSRRGCLNKRTSGVLGGLVVAGCVALALWPAASGAQEKKKEWANEPEMKIDPAKVYVARIDTTAGPIVAELYPKQALHHVNSFVFLANQGFYDGVIFHRVIPGFMIQGGDPTGTGEGGPGYKPKAQVNDLKPEEGEVLMAPPNQPHFAGRPLFLLPPPAPAPHSPVTPSRQAHTRPAR